MLDGVKENKKQYLETLQLGTLVAFEDEIKNKYNSGKIIEIINDTLIVQTQYGSKYYVKKQDVKWVKTGRRWPRGVYQKLKGEKENVGEKQTKEVL